MSASYETTQQRFFRPADVARIRRNQRRIQILRILRTAGRMFVAIALIAILWQKLSMPADVVRAALVVAISILCWFGPWTVRSNLKSADLLKGRTVV